MVMTQPVGIWADDSLYVPPSASAVSRKRLTGGRHTCEAMGDRSSVRRGENAERAGGLAAVVGWIGVGSISLAAVALVVEMTVAIPISRTVAVGLGLALGGGLGAVLSLVRSDETTRQSNEPVTVASEDSSPPEPQPADLFDGHPDPVVYFADEGNGPVVRAANAAFGTAFDVPTEQLAGSPLSEALLVAGIEDVDTASATATDLDAVVDCETSTETSDVRLRTAGSPNSGYLLFTPADEA
jgi:hypothetical protein